MTAKTKINFLNMPLVNQYGSSYGWATFFFPAINAADLDNMDLGWSDLILDHFGFDADFDANGDIPNDDSSDIWSQSHFYVVNSIQDAIAQYYFDHFPIADWD
jgi:hypothetical protein